MCDDKKEKEKKKKDVRMDRFLRVMTGGLVVTDSLLEVREDKIDEEFGYLDNYLQRMEGYGAMEEAKSLREKKKKVEKQRADAESAKKNRDQSKLLEAAKEAARELVNEANQEVYKAKTAAEDTKAAGDARETADAWIKQLENHERDFKKIDKSGKNPVVALLTAFGDELIKADKIQKVTDRPQEYNRIAAEMQKEDKKCQDCKAERLAAQRAIQAASARCDQLPKILVGRGAPVVDLKKLRSTLAECESDIGKAFADAADLDAVKKSLGDVVQKAKDLCVDVDEARAKLARLETLKTAVDNSLTAAAKAIAGIADVAQKKTLTASLTQLQDRKTQGDLLNDEAAAKQTFFALNKDALALVESANKAAFAEKANTPEGSKEIDDLIDGFGDTTTDPQQQAVCRAALAARFKLEIEIPEGLSYKRLPQLFKLMAMVPEEHLGHDMFKKLELGTEPASNDNFYSSTDKKIVLEAGTDTDKEQEYERQDGTGAKETLKYFSATALHEIGHGVDAKFTIMRDNQKSAGCGQWQKESLDSVIMAFYDTFFKKYVGNATEADLKGMLRELLTSGSCGKPAKATDALGSLLADWDAISGEDAFKTYCPAIRVDSKPWNQRHAVGTRVYQESYSNDWWSYEAAERQKGISGYQWRTPGEWFAEVYALWHLKQKKGFPDSIKQFVVGKSKSG